MSSHLLHKEEDGGSSSDSWMLSSVCSGMNQDSTYVVTEASELPPEFLKPSGENQLILGFGCKGDVGELSLIQLAFPDAVYLVDAIDGGNTLVSACKPALESGRIMKILHDCKKCSEALYLQHGIKLNNVIDTQVAYSLIEEQDGFTRTDDISFATLLADPRYCGNLFSSICNVKVDPKIWARRPITKEVVEGAANDVRFLHHIYSKMMVKMSEKSSWLLSLRVGLYCDRFFANERPRIPRIPGSVFDAKKILKEEIVHVKESCKVVEESSADTPRRHTEPCNRAIAYQQWKELDGRCQLCGQNSTKKYDFRAYVHHYNKAHA